MRTGNRSGILGAGTDMEVPYPPANTITSAQMALHSRTDPSLVSGSRYTAPESPARTRPQSCRRGFARGLGGHKHGDHHGAQDHDHGDTHTTGSHHRRSPPPPSQSGPRPRAGPAPECEQKDRRSWRSPEQIHRKCGTSLLVTQLIGRAITTMLEL